MNELAQSERAIVGCLMLSPELSGEVKAGWFDDLRLGAMVERIAGLLDEGRPVDFSTLYTLAKRDDSRALLTECQEACHSAANFAYWLETVTAAYERRRLNAAGQAFIAKLASANSNLLEVVGELEFALATPAPGKSATLDGKESAQKLAAHLEARYNLAGKKSGLVTGFRLLDHVTDGLQFGEMTLLGARPSVGKTAIGLNLVEKICLRDKIPTLIISMEMSAEALTRRLLSSAKGITINALKAGTANSGELARIAAFYSELKNAPLYIHESCGGMGALEAAGLIRRNAKRHGVRFVLLDYLQKLRADSKQEKRTYEIAESSGTLRRAIVQSGAACLILAQLNRESEKDKGRAPRLSDLADSGQIERDADNVFLLHRDRAKDSFNAALFIAKQRDGETGNIELRFDGKFCRFNEVDNRPRPESADVPTRQTHNPND